MNYKYVMLLGVCIALFYSSCKKEKVEAELFPVTLSGNNIVFSNTTSDSAFLEFALVRITQAHVLSSGKLNDGFAPDTSTLPVTLLPDSQVSIEKYRFFYKTDTLRNEDQPKTITYNIRHLATGDTARTVTTYNKNF
jgi:hypothetical protein